METAQRKQTPLIVDEASLLRLEIFSQLHAISQFEMDSKPLMPIVLAGQNNLIDKLMFHTSRPLASRVIGRCHMEGLKHRDMAGYIRHHLEVAEEAVLAIHQGSRGLLRRANSSHKHLTGREYSPSGQVFMRGSKDCKNLGSE